MCFKFMQLYHFKRCLSLGNERTVIDFESPEFTGKLSRPDGMAVDEEDKLWVALFESGKVIRIDPATGMYILALRIKISEILLLDRKSYLTHAIFPRTSSNAKL